MKKGPIVLIMLAVILLGLFSGLTLRPVDAATIQFYEGQVTANSASQTNPDIDGNNIVYQDNRSGNWDIYMYTLQPTWTPEARITTNPANQINPKIYGDTIVYQDDRSGNWDIYMYNITSRVETQITNNTVEQKNPDIYGNRIVWEDSRNGKWDIYMYDLSTQTESRVTTTSTFEYYVGGTRVWQERESNQVPSISGNRIVYQSEVTEGRYFSPNDWDISTYTYGYCFDLSTGQEFPVTPRYTSSSDPVIYDSRVVWINNGAVYTKDLTTSVGGQITSGAADRVAIYENQPDVYYIVYQDNRNGDWDIYLYNTATQTEYRVTNRTADQMRPAVSNGRIVYMDNRNGNWDIYMTTVGYAAQAGLPIATPVAAIKNIQAVKNIIAQISTSDIDGANSNVKENRRAALLNKLDAAIASVQAAADSTDSASRIMNAQSAIDQLSSVLDKADGWVLRGAPDTAGSGYTPDWIITTSASQATQIYGLKGSITMLQTLLQLK